MRNKHVHPTFRDILNTASPDVPEEECECGRPSCEGCHCGERSCERCGEDPANFAGSTLVRVSPNYRPMPDGARRSMCAACGWTYGTHAPGCTAELSF